MKKLLIALFVTLISLMSYSQNYTPNFKKIKKEVNKKKSELYYPKLLERFEAADTTLTLEQLQRFYYGAATRPDYDPYRFGDYSELIDIFKKETKETKDWQRAEEIVNEKLKEHPTSFRFYIYKHLIYENLYGEDSQQTNDVILQLMMLSSAVTSTGDGLSEKTAFYITSVTDEYGILELLDLQSVGQSLIQKNKQSYDCLHLAENIYGLDALYFNVTICMDQLIKKFGYN
jgi:hypothetical protein